MVPEPYVLGLWSAALLVPWAIVFVLRPRYRRALVWSSLFALPFGLSEILFAGRYWSPPSLFGLAERFRLDLESFVFLFGAGGVAAVAYNVATGLPIDVEPARGRSGRKDPREAALATPALVFPVGLVAFGAPITAGVVAMGAGALARVACRPPLRGWVEARRAGCGRLRGAPAGVGCASKEGSHVLARSRSAQSSSVE